MADAKISALAATTSLGDTDEMVVASSGTSKKITGANLKASAVADHLADTSDAHDASAISIADAGNKYTATDVEAALQEVASSVGSLSSVYQPLDSDLTAIAALADPNADRILFWDDSEGAYKYLSVGTSLSISGTTLNGTGLGFVMVSGL